MWFRFPDGTTQISIEQQIFEAEAKDESGNTYFRAPDHFAPTILGLGGFTRVMEDQLPKGAPADLPKSDPTRDAALDVLSADHSALQNEYNLLVGKNQELHKELQDTMDQLAGAREETERLKGVLEKIEEENKKVKK